MLYVLLMVVWFHDGTAGTSAEIYPTAQTCDAARTAALYAINDDTAQARCVAVSNHLTENGA